MIGKQYSMSNKSGGAGEVVRKHAYAANTANDVAMVSMDSDNDFGMGASATPVQKIFDSKSGGGVAAGSRRDSP